MLPTDTLEAARALPAIAGEALAPVAAALSAVARAGAPPFDEPDLIPFLTAHDDTRSAAQRHADAVRRFEDDLARAAVEAGVELE